MGVYRKKPVEIEAVQLRWDTWDEMCRFADVGFLAEGKPEGGWADPESDLLYPDPAREGLVLGLAIPTLEGVMLAREGDYIIRGIQGELYPCKSDIFKQTYEEVS